MSRSEPDAATVLSVRLTPRAGRDEIVGVDADGTLRVRVAAAPVDDAANRALVRLLAAALDVPPTSVVIVAGASGRQKQVRVRGERLTRAPVVARWPGLAVQRQRGEEHRPTAS